MIEVILPARFKKTEYLTAGCTSCGAVLKLLEEDRDPNLECSGIFCPECGGFIGKFKRHIETLQI